MDFIRTLQFRTKLYKTNLYNYFLNNMKTYLYFICPNRIYSNLRTHQKQHKINQTSPSMMT